MAERRKEIYTYQSGWPIYGLGWSHRPDQKFRLAIGSLLKDYNNKVDIIQLNDEKGEFEVKGSFDHSYPATKVMWQPTRTMGGPDLLGTTGDYLRLWEVKQGKRDVSLKCMLNNNKSSEFCAPLTSFDWNETDNALVGTSSIDTTCTIWNIETGQAKTQLIAHDKEVYDIGFHRGTDVFASVASDVIGADGSVRMFDLRSLEHSTIVYETPDLTPLLRISWNKQDPNYLSTICMESRKVLILDIRVPSLPAAELDGHLACVNGISWAPHSSCHVCSAGDDRQALIWDLSQLPNSIEEPALAYTAEAEINQLQWSTSQPDWISIAYGPKLQILRV
ncbi:hypothetical protein PROFUN_05461 [Planoprotostelium fungivorum]|uniref:Uncharacterized protein n=1 Tax=Planoprotostelium fungivorum TaxID=1890364 RepID=A0A2P6NQU8_9EUKA|nr:hypothetical protein PROFUN_05461 [Planoprotostelium fungivorum]